MLFLLTFRYLCGKYESSTPELPVCAQLSRNGPPLGGFSLFYALLKIVRRSGRADAVAEAANRGNIGKLELDATH
jgi:hypothetical protein